jgi:hypothetical protein
MSFLRLLLAEIRFRKKGFLLNAAAVLVATAVFIFFLKTSEASKRSIQIITKNMGQNVVFVDEATRPEDFYNGSGKETLFPETYVDTLLSIKTIVTTYHVAILQRRQKVGGADAILTGARPVKGPKASEEKKNPFLEIKPGTVRLGSEIAKDAGLSAGAKVTIGEKAFSVERVEEEKGTADDYRIYMELGELQRMAALPGRISAVLSMECLCEGEPLSVTEKRIRQVVMARLPDLKVITLRSIALARYETREATDRYNHVLMTLLFIAAFAFIALQSYGEALRKEKESALMTAVGFPWTVSLALYAGKAAAVALPFALAGFALGQAVAVAAGPYFAKAKVASDWALLPETLILALLCVFLSFIPALIKTISSDPFETLREE